MTNTILWPASTTEYLPVLVTSPNVDPTALVAEIAVVLSGTEPSEADWHVAEWREGAVPYEARILVGPAGGVVVVVKGQRYDIWYRINHGGIGGEVPEDIAGTLRVY